jgi:hypothetical protein
MAPRGAGKMARGAMLFSGEVPREAQKQKGDGPEAILLAQHLYEFVADGVAPKPV